MEVSINITDKTLKRDKKGWDKKNKKKTTKKLSVKILLAILLTLLLTGIIYLFYKGYKTTQDLGFSFSPRQLIEQKKDPELKKDSSGKYTNVMLVGIDTRENLGLLNTDTILVASFNHETKNLVMISIPRDFSAQVDPTKNWFNKINSAYVTNEEKKEGSGLPVLQSIVEDILGLEIQYYAMIDLKGFVSFIDAIGGITVNVENSFTDYMYPLGNGYQTVSFKAGPQEMDGDTALKYVRSRKSMHNNEGSDYARARRQQRLIEGLKDALLSSETLLNPSKLMGLLSSIQNNVKVCEFDIEDIQAGINLLKEIQQETSSSYTFVLDPLVGNRSLVSTDSGTYTIKPIAGNGKYEDINEYIQLILSNPILYYEAPSIYVYNTGLGYQATNNKAKILKENFKYLDIRFMGTKFSDKDNVYVFSNKESEFTSSVEILATFLKTENSFKPEYVTSRINGEDISILFGKEVVIEKDKEISN
jgi:LCP family protein required for cell wall assembly